MEKSVEGAILFADVSGSTKLYDTAGDAVAFAAVQACVEIFMQATRSAGGRVIKTIGDEVMAVFPDANAAALAAMEMQNTLNAQRASGGTQLGARIGFHFGAAIERDGDLFGDAVNLAARLSGVAIRGQIITSRATVDRLSVVLRGSCRQLHAIDVKGKGEVDICEVLWEEGDQTVTVMAGRGSDASRSTTLKLKCGTKEVLLNANRPTMAFGRDKTAEWVIEDTNSSRNHGVIEYRAGKFILVDHSVNGTFVTFGSNTEIVLRREECALVGVGKIAFGQSLASATMVVEFECR